ncbi:hypothetical protein GYA19_01390 [Candidatus Beckwithbacteria bacterium]|nr:hypothetical protein [Candidatus Beckwithbacteria bacterium]
MNFNFITVIIGLIFSPLAAIMAFIITYQEYSHHFSDKKEPLKLSSQAALMTLIFFLILCLIIGLLI